MTFEKLSDETAAFYRSAMSTLQRAGVRFMIGGAYALACYTGIERHTKDLDLFIAYDDLEDALRVLDADGFRTEQTHPHWLAKVLRDSDSIDLIFASGNGAVYVDETWFTHAQQTKVLEVETLLCPPEETLMMKAYVMERERYDGADIAHILRSCAGTLDWEHLINLFGPHWRILYSYLILFGFIYPSKRDAVPHWVMRDLGERLERELKSEPPAEPICRGTLLSRAQYLTDIQEHGFKDARMWPEGSMTKDEIDQWTRAIDQDAR